MWGLIVKAGMPPTRIARYCCRYLKERGGLGRTVITGIRLAESTRRSKRQRFETDSKNPSKRYIHLIFDWTTNEVWECLAVWLGLSANDVAGRLLGLFFPIMCFVAIGYEHSIANMFFIPLGMMHGASVTVSDFLLANLVPATLGNIAGGAVFVGGIYWYINK